MMNARGPGMQSKNARGTGARPRQPASQILKKLWRYLSQYRFVIIGASLLSVISNVLALLSPKLSGAAIDAIIPGSVDFPVVIRYVLLMILVAAASALLSWLLSAMMIRLSRSVVKQLRADLFNHMTRLPVSFFDTHQTGDVISTLSYDVDTVGASISTDLTQILTSLITVVGSFAMMATISPLLTCVSLFTIPISILFTRHRSRRVRPLFSARSRMLGKLNGYNEETVSGLKTIHAYHQEEEFNQRFAQHNQDATDATWRAEHYAVTNGPTVTLISNISMALVSVFGALLYMAGGITLGGVSSFVLYSRKFSGPINEFANILSELQSALAAAERVLGLIELDMEAEDAPDAEKLEDCHGEVTFRHVSFGYTPDTEVLHDIDFTAEPGKVVAIVGETGCGKTTLINLLMRFYDVTKGAILLDGKDIRTLTRTSLRQQFTMVLQDTWLFDGTVYENIAYARPEASREEVIAAAKAAHIHEMILSLPQGYDTPISSGGGSISKGQKQLMTIARAMLLDARILILDEATSNVDTRTEHLISDAMLALQKGRTSFIIAHRLSTIVDADEILVMDKGRIVERGTHAELLRKNGLYAAMYAAGSATPADADETD